MRLANCLLVLALLGVPTVASPQEVGFGVKGGLNLASMHFDPDPIADFGFRPGLVLGGFVSWPMSSRLAIQPEGLFSQKGANGSDEGVDGWIHLDYLEVPVLVQYALSESSSRTFNVFGGPSLGFNIKAKAGADVGDESVDEDISEDIEKFDFGVVFGAGVNFGRFTVDGRYTFGLSNINKDTTDGKAKNRTLAFLAGYRF
jgi:hypothetical protein